MGTLGNILWFLICGLIAGIFWIIAGLLCCITIIAIPLGVQCFKFAGLSFFPFGKDIQYGSGTVSLLGNIIWLLAVGVSMSLFFLFVGLIMCITIIGIPFGLQMFKFARLALMPFGARIVPINR